MSDDIQNKVDPVALNVVHTLHEAGYRAVFAGGCVRDSLLGKIPKDWDIATNATPEEVENLFSHTIPVGKSFGVMIVHEQGKDFEVATFRGEDHYSDGRRPDEVRYASEREDAQRRDFTINALMYNPFADEILDFVGGRRDLDQGLLRTVGDPTERFFEDHLRMLRAVRFAARVGFELESQTLDAISRNAGLVVTVSGERIGEELRRMLTEGGAEAAFRLLDQSNLMLHVLPEVARMRGMPQPEAFHPEGDVMTHTRLMCRFLDDTIKASATDENDTGGTETCAQEGPCMAVGPDGEKRALFPDDSSREILAWGVLLHDVGKPATITFAERIRFDAHDCKSAELAQSILRRLRRPNKIVEPVSEVIRRHMRFSDLRKMRTAKLRRWLNDPLFLYDLELHRIDSEGSSGGMETYSYAMRAWEDECQREPEPEPLLTGKDLIAMGYKPGPRMGNILEALEDARLEDQVTTPEDAREWVQRHYPIKAEQETE